MTNFEIRSIPFDRENLSVWSPLDQRHSNWPVVYMLHDRTQIYVGETLNAEARLKQHLDVAERSLLDEALVIIDESYNKSVCLDLESHLIRLFSGDGVFSVLNRNIGITDADYFERSHYQGRFAEVFEELRSQGLFSRSVPEIENSDLFKYSPYKALSQDQAIAVEEILEALFENVQVGTRSMSVIQGEPGTGKTVIGIFMLKLLRDIANHRSQDFIDEDALFSGLFTTKFADLAREMKIGLVIPQQSLRESVQQVFKRTPGLSDRAVRVMSAFEVGASSELFDLIVVDEAHRLGQRANQSSAALNRKFSDINLQIFGDDDPSHDQLDWIKAKSEHQILLLDTEQSVRPADLPLELTYQLIQSAKAEKRWHPLHSQMRLRASGDYVNYVRQVLAGLQATRESFADYDLRFFDDANEMYQELESREKEFGLCRLIAGYAWEWRSRKNPNQFDFEFDGLKLRWNSTTRDWVTSPNAFHEVGSIHTIQGYDLNYAGVIIGSDLVFDAETSLIKIDRSSYFDAKGKENNRVLGLRYSDDDLLRYITNIYGVLLTRGIRGTYIHVRDPELRRFLKQFF
ncbi:MAG: DNA/RNA helicase domain-containing protein [Actinomycetes bacterium]